MIINYSYGHLRCVFKVIHNFSLLVYKLLITIASQLLHVLDPWWEGYKQPPTRKILTS